jgi:toxin ParE1/3/4
VTHPFRYVPAARRDVEEAFEYYAEIAPQLAARFMDEMDRVVGKAVAAPLRYTPTDHSCRKIALKRFPYALIYRLERGAVVIHAAFHNSRNPADWKRRVQA